MRTFTAIAKLAKKSAEATLKRDANATTCTAVYQPKAPQNLKQYSKHNK